jgi:hypothetical protein
VVQYATHFSNHRAEIDPSNGMGIFQQVRLIEERDKDQLEEYLAEAMQETEQEFASHPTLRTRIQSLPIFVAGGIEGDDGFPSEFAFDEEQLSNSVSRSFWVPLFSGPCGKLFLDAH